MSNSRGAGVHCRKGRQRQGIQNSKGEGKRKNSPGRFSEALAVRNVGRGFGKHARTACGQGQKGWGKPWGVWCMELRSRRGSMRRNGARGRVGDDDAAGMHWLATKQRPNPQTKNVPIHLTTQPTGLSLVLASAAGLSSHQHHSLPSENPIISPCDHDQHQCPPSSTPCVPRAPPLPQPTPKMAA